MKIAEEKNNHAFLRVMNLSIQQRVDEEIYYYPGVPWDDASKVPFSSNFFLAVFSMAEMRSSFLLAIFAGAGAGAWGDYVS